MRLPNVSGQQNIAAVHYPENTTQGIDLYGNRASARQRVAPGCRQCRNDVACGSAYRDAVQNGPAARHGDHHDHSRNGDDGHKLAECVAGALHPSRWFFATRVRHRGNAALTNSMRFSSATRGANIWHPYQTTMRIAITIAALLLLSSCRDPRAEANIAEAMTQVGTSISEMQQDYGLLQSQVDSLRQVVARQDTIIGKLATLAGLPIQPR
jgi:hypothetical protein